MRILLYRQLEQAARSKVCPCYIRILAALTRNSQRYDSCQCSQKSQRLSTSLGRISWATLI